MANIKISELNGLTKKAYDDLVPIVDVSANETKKVSIEELIDNNVKLIAVSSEAPEECETGDKYFNLTTNKIYTAIATDTWGETGEDAKEGIMYVVFSSKSTYSYDGTTLVSVGGGSGAYIGTEEPPSDDNSNIWINPNDVLVRQDNIVKTTYNESNDNTYSTNYINSALQWKTLATGVGFNTSTNLPDYFNEILVDIYQDRYWHYNTIISKSQISSSEKDFDNGSNDASTTVVIKNNRIDRCSITTPDGTNVNGGYDVYYR